MTIKELQSFGVPGELHKKPIHEAFLAASGITDSADSSQLNLAHIIISAGRLNGKWHAFAVHPNKQEDTLGAFIENENIDAGELLRRAENWIRKSEATEFVPGIMVHSPSEDPNIALGHILVRAAER